MLAVQRKQSILDYLFKHGGGSIAELSRLMNVSEMTIRRDLKSLEDEGYIKRTHGGALFVRPMEHEPNYEEKAIQAMDMKERLARYAAYHFVRDQSVIILEGGTTISHIASFLQKLTHLTVVTNGLNTLGSLREYIPHHSVLCCGGMLRDVSYTFVGPWAENFFQQVHAEVAFFSATGYTPDSGFTDPNMLEVQVKRAMMRAAQKKVMLLDSSKFGKMALLTTFQTNEIDVLITDEGAPSSFLKELRDQGIEIHIVSDKD